ncbi:cytochrome P450 [Hypoxylon fuscum]|nr:cytochrome P450 [Hypoxylon fuscum]
MITSNMVPSCGMARISSSLTRPKLFTTYDNDRIVKSHVYSIFVQSPGVFNMFNVIDKSIHRTRRRIVGQVVHERSMRIFEPTMMEQVDIYVTLLRESCQGPDPKPINMTDRTTFLACDIIAMLAFGYPMKLQTDPENRFIVEGMLSANYIASYRMQCYRLHQARFFDIKQFLDTPKLKRYWSLMVKIIMTRTAEDDNVRHDLFSVVADSNKQAVDPGDGIRAGEVWSEAVSFFPAGAFSTSGGICAAFFYLSRNRRCYEKLANEIRTTFASSAEIQTGPLLSSCQYLRACIDETLRLAPPVPGTLWREVPHDNDKSEPVIIDGHVVPPGTQVGVSIYTLHHNEEYFPDPFAFKPERWLPSETPKAQLKAMHEAFTPFSIGYRGCAGKAMAYLESNLVLAKTIWELDFKPAHGKLGEVGGGIAGKSNGRGLPDEYQLYDIVSGDHDGPYLVFSPRAEPEKNLNMKHDD